MSKQTKTHSEKVLAKVGKRPKTAGQVAADLGYETHHGVSRTLGALVKDGAIVKSERGYSKA